MNLVDSFLESFLPEHEEVVEVVACAEGSGSVLIVDDNPLITNVLKGLLSSNEYKVFVCENGEEALQALDGKQIDVIICDVMMPRMDGYALHELVRTKPELSHIPFVFLTALDDESEMERGHEVGVDDYLTKPFDPRGLLSVVKGKVVRSRQLQKSTDEKYDLYRKRIVHTLSHEFRTPLVAINTGTELLLDGNAALDAKKAHGLLEAIRRGGERLERLVNDFMCLQQIEAGVALRMYEQRGIATKVRQLLVGFEEASLVKERRSGNLLTVTHRFQDEEVWVYDMQIYDCLSRFVSNSIKFSASPAQVEIYGYRLETDAVIEVRDRGIGLDPERIKEAIDPFGQLNRDKLEQQGGGLGLAIANRYASLNKGRIECAVRNGGGSVVSLILPLWQA